MNTVRYTLFEDAHFNQLRAREYSRLSKTGQVYLDYTGANLYPESLPAAHAAQMQQTVYGNPHSINPSSKLSSNGIEAAREAVLQYFNAPDYCCIFTANATAALQIIGESYPFDEESALLLCADNHNSVNGIREYCQVKGGAVMYAPLMSVTLDINAAVLEEKLNAADVHSNKLFAFPAQSNASGVQHNLSWIGRAKASGWDVLLDAAAFVATNKLDLQQVQPDYVTVSFYKIFGYPTGVGALLVHRSAFHKLQKRWFAGGTVAVAGVGYRDHLLLNAHHRFENGTVNFLHIPAVKNGFRFIQQTGISRIHERVKSLAGLLITELQLLHHASGLPLVKVYGPDSMENRGGTIMLNFFDHNGYRFPLEWIEQLAGEAMISLRTGCFCNPGVDEANHQLSEGELFAYFSCKRAGLDALLDFPEQKRGAVRISPGIATTAADLQRFLAFAKCLLNCNAPRPEALAQQRVLNPLELHHLLPFLPT